MANTIESTTDEALLRSLIDGSIEGKFEDDTITSLTRDGLFYGCNDLTEVYLPNLTSMNGFSFVPNSASASCTSLKTIDVPNLINFSGILYNLSALKNFNAPEFSTIANSSNAILMYCNSIEKVHLPKAPLCHFYSNNSLKYVVLPNVINVRAIRATHNGVFIALDLGETCTNLNLGGDNIFYQTENNNTEALILRSKTLLPLTRSSLNGSVNTGQGFGNFAKNKIYVPQALVEDYKVATNWSQYASCFEAIEGSKYEHYWADGTPIGFSNNYGLIGYYDVGNVNDWDSETKTISSHVENDFNAWRQTSNNQFNINNAANIPTNIYDNCYMNGGFIINFSDGTTSNVSIEDKYDVITIEFLYASSSNASININKAITNESIGTQIIGYVGELGLTFKHVVLELSKTGTKLFINKVQKRNTNDNNINRPIININNSNNCYIGHVSVWNRELTSEEIEQHYDYYVANFHVGETAFDSNGNFIAGS